MSSVPIDVPGRGEEVVEPASVQAAILLPGSPPRRPELAASQIPLAGAADSDGGSDVSSYGSNKSVDVEGSERIFDMEFDETDANQPGPATGASAPSMSRLVARLAVAHPNSSDVSSLDIGPSMTSNDDDSQKRGRQPHLNRRNSAAKVLPTSCPVSLTAMSTTTRQHDPCPRDQQADATGNDKENEQYGYRNFSSSSEEDEEEILFMKGPKKSG
ncbi:hypothetical protein DTO271G3_901 [Paecilomyces variotii]|nr:hypothetical protein DTO271G3_901 [Paecilomyces variotii]